MKLRSLSGIKFMEKFASLIAKCVYKFNNTAAFSYDTYKYCFLVLLESISGVVTGGCIAILLDMKSEAVVFFFIFILLRSYAGGIHFKTFGKCYLGSMSIMSGVLFIIKYLQISLIVSFVIVLVSDALLLVAKTFDIKNSSTENDKNLYLRKKLLQVLGVIFFLYVIFVIADMRQYAGIVAITTMVACILVLIGRWIKQ